MRLFLACSAVLLGLFSLPAAALAQHAPESFADLADRLLPSVVNISSTQKAEPPAEMPDMPHFPPGSPFEDFFNDFMNRYGEDFPVTPPASLGSGFIIDAEKGYIITNNHVVKDAEDVRVTFHDDSTVEADIVGRDEKLDIAVLKVKTEGHKLTAVKFGDSDKMRVGDWIVAIGNPFGLGGTVTAGIVSAQQRDIQAGPYDDFIQTDASINRGNSGGPMFNLTGEVIGINTAIFSPSGGSVGIGFAIPSNLVKPVISQLIEFGRTRRGWLGVKIQTVTEEIAESLGLPVKGGALVASVTPTGPADKAGLKQGDVITSFDGKSIGEMRSLPRLVAETQIGRKVPLTYWRDGKSYDVVIETGELEKAETDGLIAGTENAPPDDGGKAGGGVKVGNTGMTVRSITGQDRAEHEIPADVQGVIVGSVADMSEAAEKGMRPGDIVMEINQQPLTKPADASGIVAKAEKAGRSSVLLLVNRKGDVSFVALRLNKDGKKGN